MRKKEEETVEENSSGQLLTPLQEIKHKETTDLFDALEQAAQQSNGNKTTIPGGMTKMSVPLVLESLKKQPLTASAEKTPDFAPLLAEKDRYEILKKLGEGGMGVVELLKDHLLGREVARKTLKLGQLKDTGFTRKQKVSLWRLKQEAHITAILEHPNIIPLYEMQQTSLGELQFTMRKVEGETLREVFQKMRNEEQTYEEGKLLNIYGKICDAISYAHSIGVIHRDLKPENIMIGQFGEVYVMDWGIAKQLKTSPCQKEKFPEELLEKNEPSEEGSEHKEYLTKGGMGTQGYMAPEQAEDASKVTPASDIFALGKILKECFTLTSPQEEFKMELEYFQRDQKQGKLKRSNADRLKTELDKKVPSEVLAIIQKATAELSEGRYQSISELNADLEKYQKNLKVSAKEYGLMETLIKWAKRNRNKLIVAALILVTVTSIISYFQWKSWNEKEKQFAQTKEELQKQKELAHGVEGKNREEIGFKMDSLLQALNLLNSALALKPKHEEMIQEKWGVGKELLNLCFETKDYSLAGFVAREIDPLEVFKEKEDQHLQENVQQERDKALTQHKNRLAYWKSALKDPLPGMRDDALLEISKMQEEEIFKDLEKEVKIGTEYFL
ncbi:MAG: serine/threonine-protein kinase, partial [Planctomycetota bacterium]